MQGIKEEVFSRGIIKRRLIIPDLLMINSSKIAGQCSPADAEIFSFRIFFVVYDIFYMITMKMPVLINKP